MTADKPKKRAVRKKRLPEGVKLASEYVVSELKWLWSGRLPLGKVSILEGDPSRGKSMLTADWAARVTSGDPWPATSVRVKPSRKRRREPRGVVMVCGEDDWGDTIVPRLLAAGADLSRVASILVERDEDGYIVPLTIPRDLDRLAEAVRAVNAELLIIDPITAYLDGRTDTHNDASTRKALMPLQMMAASLGISVLLVRHLNKNTTLKAEYRGGGSIAFSAAARSVLLVERHPDEDGVFCLAQAKTNLGAYAPTLTYRIEEREIEHGDLYLESAGIKWLGSTDMSLAQIMRGPDARRDAPLRDECAKEIVALLGEKDPRPSTEMKRLLSAAGYSADTIKAAKKQAGARSVRERDPKTRETKSWNWTLGGGADEE